MDNATLKSLAGLLHTRVSEYCVKKYADEHRSHLGASVIGSACHRYIWSSFRWLKFEIFPAHMLRLFNRGKREEPLLIEYLQAAGVTNFRQFDLTSEQQASFSSVSGHYGGSTDGLGVFENLNVVIEFKTHNTKSFVHLKKNGVIIGKPRHYAQMCAYGKSFGIEHGLYVAVNKNDDDIYFEFVKLDFHYADDLAAKAFDIIFAKVPPPKIALQSTSYECSYCVFQGICHRGEPVDRNCRSCINAVPVADGQWSCQLYNQIIPKDFILKGCTAWQSILKDCL